MRDPIPSPATTTAPSSGVGQAAQGPIPAPVSAAGVSARAMPVDAPDAAAPVDAPDAARGRRTLSTAFVRVGPDGYLTVDLRDGRALVLREVEMRAQDYCGTRASGERHCGGYAEVAAARPGGGPATTGPVADPGGPGRAAPPRR